MQEFELWWLLVFPVFFGLGWLAARIDMREVLASARAVPASYFKGLTALVDADDNEAVRRLAEVARTQPKAVELQVALGKLYRRRGENDLAIRLHQQLLAEPDLTEPQRDSVNLELAEDFLKAGLVDRAEEILAKLAQASGVGQTARQRLLDIYQQERDWPRAIALASELRSEATSFQRELAEYHCELAQTALIKSDLATARAETEQAFAANRRCPRASLIAGDIELADGKPDAAITAWQAIEAQNPEYLTLAAERLLDAYERLGKLADGVKLLRGWLASYPQLDLVDLLYPRVAQLSGDAEGLAFLRDTIHANPSLGGMAKLIDARFASLTPDSRQDAELARELMLSYSRRLHVHRCKRCNFRSKTFFWHCPACGEWESFTPNRSETASA